MPTLTKLPTLFIVKNTRGTEKEKKIVNGPILVVIHKEDINKGKLKLLIRE